MDKLEQDSWFRIDHASVRGVSTVTIRIATTELMAIVKALQSTKVMEPICKVVDDSALGKALAGSTYCARCRNQFGEIEVSHQFSAKNWASAWAKAVGYCKGSFQLVRGKCATQYGKVVNH